ncbi:MAG: TIGR01459 family HAD-type hydrolase [Alphaproteobacteria bacterium]|nr:TIGR01459 family HAD-type hydrolase [Alphaproteobacteria bacterium]
MIKTSNNNVPFYDDLNFMIKDSEGLILDIWGVLWDGINVYPEALNTLKKLRKLNIPIVLLSNAPRKSEIVSEKLSKIGIKQELYDKIISSGDVCRNSLINNTNLVSGLKYYFIGLKEDNDLLNNTRFQKSQTPENSDFILITGPRDFDHILKDYTDELKKCLKNKLPMICANPDKIVVRQNGKKIFCAGAIAEDYAKLGGTVKQFGKPYKNVFLEALKHLKKLSPKINLNNVSIIGDGLETDILGGNTVKINTVLITSGILSHTLNTQYGQRPDLKKLNKAISSSGNFPKYAVNTFKISS